MRVKLSTHVVMMSAISAIIATTLLSGCRSDPAAERYDRSKLPPAPPVPKGGAVPVPPQPAGVNAPVPRK